MSKQIELPAPVHYGANGDAEPTGDEAWGQPIRQQQQALDSLCNRGGVALSPQQGCEPGTRLVAQLDSAANVLYFTRSRRVMGF